MCKAVPETSYERASEVAAALVPPRGGVAEALQLAVFGGGSGGRGCLECVDARVDGGDDGALSVVVIRGL